MYSSRAIFEPAQNAGISSAVPGLWRLVPYLVLGAVVLSPLLQAQVPPLVDYPNHLARVWILVHGADISELASNYVAHWRLLPYLGMDLVVTGLSLVMSVEQAGRLFIALTMLALIGGTAALHRALHGRFGIWPIFSVLFIYNWALFWGFLDCLFATGVYLFAFSGWIATQNWRFAPRLGTFSAIAGVLLLLHLFAFGLYALSVGSYELGGRLNRRVSRKDLCALAAISLQFVPGILLLCASLAHGGSTAIAYGNVVDKSYALLLPFIFSNPPVLFDRAAAPLITMLMAAAIVTRTLKLAPEMRLPLIAMIIAALLMPNRIGAWLADIRLPVRCPSSSSRVRDFKLHAEQSRYR